MLTDFSDAMASYWERDPLITQFVQMGYMDYGVMDIESDTELRLRRANVTLTEDCLQAPPFFVCSFLFSSLPQDAVRMEDGTLKPALVSLLRPFPEPIDGDAHYRYVEPFWRLLASPGATTRRSQPIGRRSWSRCYGRARRAACARCTCCRWWRCGCCGWRAAGVRAAVRSWWRTRACSRPRR